MKDIIFIVGPTALGKTEVSYHLASQINAQIASCDSMLIYRQPQIITSKPPSYILDEIKHYFVGSISVSDSYSVFDYCRQAFEVISELSAKDVSVVVCGGSGLYVKAILDGVIKGPARDQNLRNTLLQRAELKGNQYLHEELKKVDLKSAEKISINDLKRIIRALEVYYTTGLPMSAKRQKTTGLWGKFPVKIFGLRTGRENMYDRINKRVDLMFEQGAIDEVRELLKLDLSITAEKIIGIKEIEKFLNGTISQEQALDEMKKNTRNFAKRQVTWFKKDSRIKWIDVDELSPEQLAGDMLKRIKR